MNFLKSSLILFLILTVCHPILAQSNVIDEVIATVGDKPILKSDIEQQYQQSIIEGHNGTGDMKCKIFEDQLIQKLLLNQAVLDSIEVSENEVVNQVDSRMNYFIQQIGDKEKLEEYFNKSIIQIKREQIEMVRNQMLTQRMQSSITKNIKLTPSEVRLFYKNAIPDSLPMVNTQYEISQISIYPPIEQKEIDRVKDQLRDFQKQVADGRDFSTLAVLYSEDPGSATRGGDLGWMTRGQLVPEFANVAFNLQDKNKVSKIVETEYGFHIIQLLDRKGERINVRHILLKPKISAKAKETAINYIDSIAKLITNKDLIFEAAALRFSMDKDTRTNGGSMVNQSNNSIKFEISELEPEIIKQIQTLKIDELSPPLLSKDAKGKDVYKIIIVKNETKPHRANIKDDYQLLSNMLAAKKKDDTFKNWIKVKQNETYISIDKNWTNCDFNFPNWIK